MQLIPKPGKDPSDSDSYRHIAYHLHSARSLNGVFF